MSYVHHYFITYHSIKENVMWKSKQFNIQTSRLGLSRLSYIGGPHTTHFDLTLLLQYEWLWGGSLSAGQTVKFIFLKTVKSPKDMPSSTFSKAIQRARLEPLPGWCWPVLARMLFKYFFSIKYFTIITSSKFKPYSANKITSCLPLVLY